MRVPFLLFSLRPQPNECLAGDHMCVTHLLCSSLPAGIEQGARGREGIGVAG